MKTLEDLANEVRVLLGLENAGFSDQALEEGIRLALALWNEVAAVNGVSQFNLEADGREILLPENILGFKTILRVWLPFEPSGLEHWRRFEVVNGTLLRVLDGDLPLSSQVVRLNILRGHTIAGLDGQSSSSLDGVGEAAVSLGAAAQVVAMRRRELSIGYPVNQAWEFGLSKVARDWQAQFERLRASQRQRPAGGMERWR